MDFPRRSSGSRVGREFGGAVVTLLENKPGLGQEIAVNPYKNSDVRLWIASGIDRRLAVCHALLSIFTKTLV